MADIANFSPYHFNRVFSTMTGLPPRRFLASLRIEAAKELLESSDMTVTRVCNEVGYESLGTFTTRFTELVGMAPSSFKRARNTGALGRALRGRPPAERGPLPTAGIPVTGSVAGGEGRLVLVGLFGARTPNGVPSGCGQVGVDGGYGLKAATPGLFWVLAFSPPTIEGELALVGAISEPIAVGGRPVDVAVIELRPMTVRDPPMLLSFQPS